MAKRTPFRRRGGSIEFRDHDRSKSFGQRHYANIQRMKQGGLPQPSANPRPVEPIEIVRFPDPPEEHYCLLIRTRKPFDTSRLKDLQRHFKRDIRVLDQGGHMILIDHLRLDDFSRMHIPALLSKEEYTVARLPFSRLPEPLPL